MKKPNTKDASFDVDAENISPVTPAGGSGSKSKRTLDTKTQGDPSNKNPGAGDINDKDMAYEMEAVGGPGSGKAKNRPADKKGNKENSDYKMMKSEMLDVLVRGASKLTEEQLAELIDINDLYEEKDTSYINDDLNVIVGSFGDLDESVKTQTATLFEAAVSSKITILKEALIEKYDDILSEAIDTQKEELSESVGEFLDYVAEKWMDENELAVSSGLKVEMAENLMKGLSNLFEENNIIVPDDQVNLVDNLTEKLDEAEKRESKLIAEHITLKNTLFETNKDLMVDEITDGLAATDVERFKGLIESIDADGEDEYKEKLQLIKESYFPSHMKNNDDLNTIVNLNEEVKQKSYAYDGMDAYVNQLKK